MPPGKTKTHALFFVEGYTEVEFYKPIIISKFQGLPKTIFNLKGLYNIHRKTYGHTLNFLQRKQDSNVRIFCCLDRESRFNAPPLNLKDMREHFKSDPRFNGKVLSVDTIVATQMLESWFFYDTENIYKFLNVPKARRNLRKFSPPEKFTHNDLSALFRNHKKSYIKGEKCAGFIGALDLNKIQDDCDELKNGLEKIKERFGL